MVLKPAGFIVLILFCSATRSPAQPALPDITGNATNGTVTLSWVSQYSSIKAISVLRSHEPEDFTLIGYVQALKKGAQSFTDNNPLPGRNCYKLAIEFKSGLIWRSNYYCLSVEKYMLESDKPLIHHADTIKAPVAGTKVDEVIMPVEDKPIPAMPKIKLPQIAFDTIDNTSTLIKPRYLFTDPRTGHINMFLPDDVNTHHYSVKFFDLQSQLITEVPRITTAAAIIDKRNFQRKRTIRFVLRKDGVELEGGYLVVGN